MFYNNNVLLKSFKSLDVFIMNKISRYDKGYHTLNYNNCITQKVSSSTPTIYVLNP